MATSAQTKAFRAAHLTARSSRAFSRAAPCSCSQYSYDTDFHKTQTRGSDKHVTAVETGWLWEASAKTTKVKLDHLQVKPKKSLGQNFVVDEDVLERIVSSTGLQPGDPVIEFGPGTGNLTRHLLQLKVDVTAIEKDDVLQKRLRDEFRESSLKVVHADVMLINIRSLVADILDKYPGRDRIMIVSNLPYNITTDCLKLYMPMGDIISNLMFMIQDEVAERLCTQTPGHPSYRAREFVDNHDVKPISQVMTVFAQHFSQPEYLFKIKKTAYYPQPLVDGALVNFKLKTPEERAAYSQESQFLSFVEKSFSSKRKKLTNSLRPMYEPEDIKAALDREGLSENVRGQGMTYHQFVSVFNSLEDLKLSKNCR